MDDIEDIDLKKSSGTFEIQYIGDNKTEKFSYNIPNGKNNLSWDTPLVNWIINMEPSDKIIKKDNQGIIVSFKLVKKDINIVHKTKINNSNIVICSNIKSTTNIYFNNIIKNTLSNNDINHLFTYIKSTDDPNCEISSKLRVFKEYYLKKNESQYHCDSFELMYNSFNKYFVVKNTFKINEYMVCVIPGHKASTFNASSTVEFANKCIKRFGCEDGINTLLRYETIEPKHKTPGKRTEDVDLNSIGVNKNINIKDKKIILIDDITTSGSSLDVGKKLLYNSGAKQVICFAFGKTWDKWTKVH